MLARGMVLMLLAAAALLAAPMGAKAQHNTLTPEEEAAGWVLLLNGKDTTGWHQRGGGTWTVEDGVLVGRDGPGHLFTDRTYADLELRAMVRVNARGNSGIYFRTYPFKENPDTWPNGYEAQVDHHDPKNFTGVIYDRAWPAEIRAPITRDGEWFEYRIRAVGNHIQTWINGTAMVDARLDQFAEGHIALQTHHQGNRIEYRDVKLLDLSRKAEDGAAATDRRGSAGPVRLFYCTHSAGFRHDVLPETREIMARLGEELDWLEVEVSDDITELDEAKLASLDAVMLYTTGRLPLDTQMLTEWVRGGGALIGVHSATDTLADDRVYVEKIGGTFDGHPWNEAVTVVIDRPEHPAMKPFAPEATGAEGASFEIADEIYQFRTLNPENVVLMHLSPETPRAEAGREYPLAWCRESGRGRVFYTALGHRPEVWRDERFIAHLLGGIRWATRE